MPLDRLAMRASLFIRTFLSLALPSSISPPSLHLHLFLWLRLCVTSLPNRCLMFSDNPKLVLTAKNSWKVKITINPIVEWCHEYFCAAKRDSQEMRQLKDRLVVVQLHFLRRRTDARHAIQPKFISFFFSIPLPANCICDVRICAKVAIIEHWSAGNCNIPLHIFIGAYDAAYRLYLDV